MQGFGTGMWDTEGWQKPLFTQKHTCSLCTANNYHHAGLLWCLRDLQKCKEKQLMQSEGRGLLLKEK